MLKHVQLTVDCSMHEERRQRMLGHPTYRTYSVHQKKTDPYHSPMNECDLSSTRASL